MIISDEQAKTIKRFLEDEYIKASNKASELECRLTNEPMFDGLRKNLNLKLDGIYERLFDLETIGNYVGGLDFNRIENNKEWWF